MEKLLHISEDYIKRVLQTHQERRGEIHKRLMAIYDELQDTDSLLRSVSIKKIEWDRIGHQQGGTSDLTDIMLRHQQVARENGIELRQEMIRLTEEEELNNRIWVCFNSISGKGHDYLKYLYVKGYPYKAVEQESGVSHKTFEKTRQDAIKQIQRLCESDLNNIEIINLSRPQGIKKANKKQKSEYEQMTLEL